VPGGQQGGAAAGGGGGPRDDVLFQELPDDVRRKHVSHVFRMEGTVMVPAAKGKPDNGKVWLLHQERSGEALGPRFPGVWTGTSSRT
jgi:hypothetical protein